jgi:hypothetical protein
MKRGESVTGAGWHSWGSGEIRRQSPHTIDFRGPEEIWSQEKPVWLGQGLDRMGVDLPGKVSGLQKSAGTAGIFQTPHVTSQRACSNGLRVSPCRRRGQENVPEQKSVCHVTSPADRP